MAQVKEKLWTLEEFLAFDDGTDTSYQLFEGRIVAMKPPLRGHGTLVVRLAAMVSSQSKPPCEAMAEVGPWVSCTRASCPSEGDARGGHQWLRPKRR